MQDDSGLKKILSLSWAYGLLQWLVGTPQAMRWVSANCWNLKGGETVVDIGCGPGGILRYLPPTIKYIGFDISEKYIEAARKRWGSRGEFVVGTAESISQRFSTSPLQADLVLCNGVLHHLDDIEVLKVLDFARQVLGRRGRFVVLEPTYLLHQTRLSKFIMSRDRGQNIRSDNEWRRILSSAFHLCDTRVLTGLIRIPYIHLIAECRLGMVGESGFDADGAA